MVDTHPRRIFRSGDATTLYVASPAEAASDSQFPFEADDEITVTIEWNRLVVTENTEGTDK